MTKLSDHGAVEQKAGEITIVFKPQVPFPLIRDLVNECITGTCSCGCDEMLVKIDKIIAEDGPDGATIHLKGGDVKAQDVEKYFFKCDQKIPVNDK